MKTKNEMSRGSERNPYEIPTTSVHAIAYALSILNGSGGPTEMEDGGNDC